MTKIQGREDRKPGRDDQKQVGMIKLTIELGHLKLHRTGSIFLACICKDEYFVTHYPSGSYAPLKDLA